MKKNSSLIRYFSIIDRFSKQMLDRQLAPYGLNSSNHMFLMKIAENQGISQDKLLSMFYIHPSNITRGLAALEKNGLIKRLQREDDKRSYEIYLTEMGESIIPDVFKIVKTTNEALAVELSEKEATELNKLLDKILEGLVEKNKLI